MGKSLHLLSACIYNMVCCALYSGLLEAVENPDTFIGDLIASVAVAQ